MWNSPRTGCARRLTPMDVVLIKQVWEDIQKTSCFKQLQTCVNATPDLQCTDDNRSYRNICNMPFSSFCLAVIFIGRLFNTSVFRVPNLKKVRERRSHALPCHYTLAYTHNMWPEQVKTYTHIYVCNVCEFLGTNYCIPKR